MIGYSSLSPLVILLYCFVADWRNLLLGFIL
jgi:hypothetical protein